MIHTVDDRLREEAKRFHLSFACPECAAYDPVEIACSFGFPTEPHRNPHLEGRGEVIFCKAFELW